ncbi:MAG: DUF2271 domain-containing protein [Bacteroidota bacterium]
MKCMPRLLLSLFMVSAVTTWAGVLPNPKKAAKLYESHFENVLGTSLQIRVKSFSGKQASLAEAAALNEIERLNHILSGYDPNSEFGQWLKTYNEPQKISPELFEVLSLFDQWKNKTGGALDASAQVISKLWKDASAKQTIPTQAEIDLAIAEVKNTHWVLDVANQTATHTSKAPLMLNSFAKTYIIKKAADAAMATDEVNGVMVNIGGDIVIAGNLKETIQISDPKADAENDAPIDQLLIGNKAVATSGNYRRGEMVNGKWYSHIIDPRTGMPADEVISATVISPNATDAGALATAFNIVTPEEAAKLAAAVPGTEYLLITRNGDRIESKGWKAMEAPVTSKTKKIPTVVADQWTDYELVVNLELAQFAGFARRPFVAVWVTDKDKNTVRTIAVWFNKDKWLHEARAWYTSNFSKFSGAAAATMSTISSATRPAGKYSLKWDGKDDKGNYVKPGKYTINIEAVREHGGYDLLSEDINCMGKPAAVTLKAGSELASASLDFHKKNN